MSEEKNVSENPSEKTEVTETIHTETGKQENKETTTVDSKPVENEAAGTQPKADVTAEQKQSEPAKEKVTEPEHAGHQEEEKQSTGEGNVPPAGGSPASGSAGKPSKKQHKAGKILLKYVLVFLVAGGGAFCGSYAAERVARNQQEKEMQNAFRNFSSQLPFGENGNSQTQSDGPALGITIQQTDNGIEIVGFADNSNAQKAGLKEGDIITKVDGKEYDSVSDISGYISSKKVGNTVKVTVKRDNEEKTYSVKLVKKDLSAYSIPSMPDQNDDNSSSDSSTPKALPGTSGENSGLQG